MLQKQLNLLILRPILYFVKLNDMRKEKKLFLATACMLCLGAGSLSANVMQVHFNGQDPMHETELGLIDKVTFSGTGFTILLNDQSTENFTYGNVKKITFTVPAGNVETQLVEASELLVSPNPVGATLNVKGFNATEPAQLAIYSVAGGEVLRVNGWNGESIDVAHLAAGIYILKINNQTIKFIKQ